MLIAPNDNLTAHAVSVNPPTAENRDGYHRLIGGSVELGESHRDAIVREVYEELGAVIRKLDFLATVDNIFRINGSLGHEVVFLYSGRLDPPPVTRTRHSLKATGTSFLLSGARSLRPTSLCRCIRVRLSPGCAIYATPTCALPAAR